ncbi:Serine/arginine-rich splicing factor like [Actinidia chinensis var. chinensis]|uniref:Serine/arginine-rich splicing factor like n=1 Tax=Actinidia chinensis var. chinensis TaxID=1590841 RepID=A0A2R6Q1W0_ACTCC|nr:Serine/arginine-rich splicing factor like [Actinidia chinensis var. chinensis]
MCLGVCVVHVPFFPLTLPYEFSQYSYEVRHEWPENSYPTAASMKKLINEEISKGPKTRRNAPSVVARLMGMDMLPLDTKIGAQKAEKKNEKPGTNFPHKEQSKKGSGGRVHCNSNSSRQIESDSFQHNKDRDLNHQHVGMRSKKPRHREHPQEEELQKFKKEFEAWQAARFRECSKVVELGRIPSQWLAQETLNMEKVALYSNTSRISGTKNSMELEGNVVKTRSREAGELQNHKQRKELCSSEQKETYPLRSRTLSRDFEQSLLKNYGQKLDISSAPTRIVILRPGPERVSDNDDSWISSSGTSEERGSMEDFLEEVKQRLKNELQGKIKKGTMVRGGGVETPYSEKPSDPKQIAQRIAKQVRESVPRDFGENLVRSESTRSYRSEIQYNGPDSPEFINRDTRRFLAARLKNVLKAETNLHIPTVATGSSNSSALDNEKGRVEESISSLKVVGNMNCCDIVEDEPEMQSRSFRRGPDDDVMTHRDLSPRNLFRSLSAPVSGTSFGKLLLEDRHILTGAHIRRKHEAIENVTMEVKKWKKERFSFKEKVSNFKYSFTLRGRLFGRKIQSIEQPHKYEFDSMKDITSGPTVVMNFGERHENCTEVPPSPASVCSSVYEESWRAADHLSSASTPDLSPLEDTTVPRVFREISSNLNELRKQLNKLGAGGPKEVVIEEHPLEAEMELEDETEAYIRDLLVASGLYEGSSDKVLSRWDPFAKPISNQIFEQVEESYMKMNKDNEGSRRGQGEKKVDHKLLLDLLNEALAIVLGPPMTMSRFRKKAIGPTPRPPHGRKLLDHVWEIVGEHLHPPNKIGYMLDRMVARDLGYTPWSGLMSDDIDALGKDMESQIIGVLIDEILIDLKS